MSDGASTPERRAASSAVGPRTPSGDAAEAERAIEWAVRTAYGRLVALLASRSGDIAAAEDALSDALATALVRWPQTGVPASPDAWLLSVAKRRMLDAYRRDSVRTRAAPLVAHELLAHVAEPAPGETELPDARLALLFACAHPAIDARLHAPLMLQAILGLDAAAIAAAFLVAPATMAQRLVRAKARIRDAGIRFVPPVEQTYAERLPAVLEAIYAAYGAGWELQAGAELPSRDLRAESIWLARVAAAVLPHEPEALGLLALLLFCESRQAARRAPDGGYLPLSEQDVRLWNAAMITEAEARLWEAARLARMGRFQLEAAIQSLHAGRRHGRVPIPAVLTQLYAGLLTLAPTAGAHVAYAAALLESDGPEAALTALDALSAELAPTYQPWWATRAAVLERLARSTEAVAA